jgi:hypothetical protein
MLKQANPEKEIERHAATLFEELLGRVASLKLTSMKVDPRGPDSGIDLLARVKTGGNEYFLVGEVKQSGQPRFAREAINQLKAHLSRSKRDEIPVFIAPFLTTATQEMCRAEGVGYLDFGGNAFLSFGPVYIERSTGSKPEAKSREFRSLFKPRSAEVLRVLLRNPSRSWKLSELAEESGVSIGHVSNVRNALADREWIADQASGIKLASPNSLLDAWRDSYQIPAAQDLKFYTSLHGAGWQKSLREYFENESNDHVALASFSAAQWIAPYARNATNFLYADADAIPRLERTFQLTKPAMGENVIIWVPSDDGVFTDSFAFDEAIRCTSPLQTYLDLTKGGDRGLEAAEHLREAKLKWPK